MPVEAIGEVASFRKTGPGQGDHTYGGTPCGDVGKVSRPSSGNSTAGATVRVITTIPRQESEEAVLEALHVVCSDWLRSLMRKTSSSLRSMRGLGATNAGGPVDRDGNALLKRGQYLLRNLFASSIRSMLR